MCIAILSKAGKVVSDGNIARSAGRNRDGGGFAYVDKDNGKVKIRKGFMTAAEFLKAYHETLEQGHGENNPMMLHFRIATLGKVGTDNCHPFVVPNGALIHNGSLWTGGGYGSSDVEKSDTREFAERISVNLTPEILRKSQVALELEVGYNKLAFLFDEGEYVILNETSGSWDDGVWYSNNTYKDYGAANSHYRSYKTRDAEDIEAASCDVYGQWPMH